MDSLSAVVVTVLAGTGLFLLVRTLTRLDRTIIEEQGVAIASFSSGSNSAAVALAKRLVEAGITARVRPKNTAAISKSSAMKYELGVFVDVADEAVARRALREFERQDGNSGREGAV